MRVESRVWSVEVYGYGAVEYAATSKGAARYRAYRTFREYIAPISFGEFLARGVTVKRARGLV